MDLETITSDRKSGQSKIIAMTLELLKRHRKMEERLKICRKICEAHKAMSGLRWILRSLEEGKSVYEIEEEIREMEERCVRNLESVVEGKIIATMSRSHLVERALLKAKHVIVLESTPGREGLEMARFLRGRGLSATTFPDSALSYAVKACDFVVVGADAVLERYFINKTGTLPLALTAKHFGKAFYVASPSYKFADVDFEEIANTTFREEMLFERIPKELVTEFVTD